METQSRHYHNEGTCGDLNVDFVYAFGNLPETVAEEKPTVSLDNKVAYAHTYVYSPAAAKVMLQAIRLVLAGGAYLPPQLMHLLDAGTEAAATTASDVAHDDGVACLSPRQREVFALLARGLSNKMIARQLGITEGTVKSHVATIFDLLKVHNRVSAVAEARRLADGLDARRRADA